MGGMLGWIADRGHDERAEVGRVESERGIQQYCRALWRALHFVQPSCTRLPCIAQDFKDVFLKSQGRNVALADSVGLALCGAILRAPGRKQHTVDFLEERTLHRQPTGPNPLCHRDDLADRPRAMEVPTNVSSRLLLYYSQA